LLYRFSLHVERAPYQNRYGATVNSQDASPHCAGEGERGTLAADHRDGEAAGDLEAEERAPQRGLERLHLDVLRRERHVDVERVGTQSRRHRARRVQVLDLGEQIGVGLHGQVTVDPLDRSGRGAEQAEDGGAVSDVDRRGHQILIRERDAAAVGAQPELLLEVPGEQIRAHGVAGREAAELALRHRLGELDHVGVQLVARHDEGVAHAGAGVTADGGELVGAFLHLRDEEGFRRALRGAAVVGLGDQTVFALELVVTAGDGGFGVPVLECPATERAVGDVLDHLDDGRDDGVDDGVGVDVVFERDEDFLHDGSTVVRDVHGRRGVDGGIGVGRGLRDLGVPRAGDEVRGLTGFLARLEHDDALAVDHGAGLGALGRDPDGLVLAVVVGAVEHGAHDAAEGGALRGGRRDELVDTGVALRLHLDDEVDGLGVGLHGRGLGAAEAAGGHQHDGQGRDVDAHGTLLGLLAGCERCEHGCELVDDCRFHGRFSRGTAPLLRDVVSAPGLEIGKNGLGHKQLNDVVVNQLFVT